MVNADPAALGGTGAVRNAPAPWVPYTRAGCDVGNVGIANTVLENNNAIMFRSPPTTLAAAAAIGATNVKVASVAGLADGADDRDRDRHRERARTGVDRHGRDSRRGRYGRRRSPHPLAKAHASGAALAVTATDPTGDMTKVFGEGSPEWNEGKESQIAPSGTAARALAQTDFVGIAIHCAVGRRHLHREAERPARLAARRGGRLHRLQGALRREVRQPGDQRRLARASTTPNGAARSPTRSASPASRASTACSRRTRSGYVAQMQEAGVPVTFAYISDAHDFHGVSGNTHVAYGPGEAGYVQQLKDYDKAFGDFFTRLKNDGITKDNTLFVVTVEEGDHFAGTAPDAPCDGVTTRVHVCERPRDRGERRPQAPRRDVQREPWHLGDDELQRPLGHGAERLRHRQSGARLGHRPRPREGDVRHEGDEPALGREAEAVRRDGRPGRGEAPPHGHGRPGADADVHAVRAGRLLPQRVLDGALREQRPVELRLPAEHGATEPDVRLEPRRHPAGDRARPGSGSSGRVSRRAAGRRLWSDHTDIRPTMLALLGLKDSYVSDGRVLTEIPQGRRPAEVAQRAPGTVEELGAAYKQIMASFGQFSMDTLIASTGALASNTPGDSDLHRHRERARRASAHAGRARRKIRLALWNAEFNGQKIDEKQARSWIDQANRPASTGRARSPPFRRRAPNAKKLGKINHIVVIYEENHSFDNLYGGWEGVNGLANADAAHTIQVNQAGNAYACLKQNDVNLTSPARSRRRAPTRRREHRRDVREPLHERAVHDRRLHPADRHDVPADPLVVQPGQRLAEGDRARPAAAPATWSTASTRSSTSSTAASRTATSPAATRSA